MINVVVNSDSRYPINKLAIHATVLDIVKRHHIQGNVEIGISIIGDRKMHEINRTYRGIDKTTNILSFALEDPVPVEQIHHIPKFGFVKALDSRTPKKIGFVKSPDNVLRLGDILLSYPEVLKDAASEGVAVDEVLHFLVEHGMKHLLGVHHD